MLYIASMNNNGLINKYINGELNKNDEVVTGAEFQNDIVFTPGEQARLKKDLLEHVQEGMRVKQQGESF